MATPIGATIPSETVSTALKHGWAWKIPLTARLGNGYVYSSQSCSADQAETELRERLGLLDSDTPARHLKMRVGRVTKHWNKNCLAVGLSQGFIEPLEATALLFIQQTAAAFVDFLEQGDLSEAAQARFNTHVNEHFEGTRDYIVTHYKTNSRTDTDYWRANAANRNISEPLKQLLNLWMSGNGIAPAVRKQSLGKRLSGFFLVLDHVGNGDFPGSEGFTPACSYAKDLWNRRNRQPARAQRGQLSGSSRSSEQHSAAPQRSNSAGVFLVKEYLGPQRRADPPRGTGRQAPRGIARLGARLARRWRESRELTGIFAALSAAARQRRSSECVA